MYFRKNFLFKSKLDQKKILLILMALYFSSPLLACSSPEDDDPRLRGVYESSTIFFEIKDCNERISNLENLLENDPVIFNSRNGFITFYNICFELTGAYGEMKDQKSAYQTLNKILDHPLCDAKTLEEIDKTASTRLPILIQLNIQHADVDHCFQAVRLFSELTNTDLVESYRFMFEKNHALLFAKPRMQKALLDKALEAVNRNSFFSMSPADHDLYYRCLLGQPRQDIDAIFKDESMYQHGKNSLESKEINPENRIKRLEYLSKTSFQLGYYKDCIVFFKELLLHKGGLNEEEKIEFAQSYYQLGSKEEAIKILSALFEREITIAVPSLDLCLMLFDCFPDTADKYIQSSIIGITLKVLPQEEINKKDKHKKKTNSNSYSQTRSRVIQEFIKNRLQKGKDEFDKINSIKLDTLARFYTAENGFENTDELAEMRSLQEKCSKLFDDLQSLSPSSLSEAKKARELSDFLKESASKLVSFNASVQEIIRNSMREKSLKVSTTSAPIYDSDTPGPSLKSQVMSEHSKKVAKVKTRGTPDDRDLQDDLGSSETSKEPEIQGNSIGNFIGVAEKIFYEDDVNIREFPKELISIVKDRLNTLNRCQSIIELQTNLPPGADLKKLSGDSTTWQFRINDTYRVRFTLGDDKFLNVNVGDFH